MYYQVVPVGAPAPTRTDTVDLSIGTTGGGRDVDFATLVEQVPLVPFAWSRVGGCARVSQSSRVSLRRRSRQSTQRPLNGRRRSETIGVREIDSRLRRLAGHGHAEGARSGPSDARRAFLIVERAKQSTPHVCDY
jgi:hypothetical protein